MLFVLDCSIIVMCKNALVKVYHSVQNVKISLDIPTNVWVDISFKNKSLRSTQSGITFQ